MYLILNIYIFLIELNIEIYKYIISTVDFISGDLFGYNNLNSDYYNMTLFQN